MSQQRRMPQIALPDVAKRGIIEEIREGLIHVQDATDSRAQHACFFVRNSSNPPPDFQPGDHVLFTVNELSGEAFVLGLIESYVSKADRIAAALTQSGRTPSTTTVEDEVVRIKAGKGLVIECGKGTIIITEDGRIQIKGTDLLSRARGMNKIKGAGIALN